MTIFCPKCQIQVPQGFKKCPNCKAEIDVELIGEPQSKVTESEFVAGGFNWVAIGIGAGISLALWYGVSWSLRLLDPLFMFLFVPIEAIAISAGSFYAAKHAYSSEITHGFLSALLVAIVNTAIFYLFGGFVTIEGFLFRFALIGFICGLSGGWFGSLFN